MRRVPLVLVLSMVACGGASTDPLRASFALGPSSVTHALAQRYATTIAPGASVWPPDAQPLETDVVVESDAYVDVGPRREDWGSDVDVEGASIEIGEAVSPFSMVEVLVGPIEAVASDDPSVKRVAHAAVPEPGGAAPLVWDEGGRHELIAALLGAFDVEQGTRFSLFLRARATVRLTPGDPLPSGDGALHLVLPVRPTR